MKNSNSINDQGQILIMLGWIILFALLPPVTVVIFFCFILSDGTIPGFLGCLSPFLILVFIVLLTMNFS